MESLELYEPNVDYKSNFKHRCYKFSLDVIKMIGVLDIRKIYSSLLDQLLRSSTSIGANVIEGKSESSKKDLVKFYQIALKSANETKYWLCLIRDSFDNIDKLNIKELLLEVSEIANILAASIITLKKSLTLKTA
jgi:four helix bundle protein